MNLDRTFCVNTHCPKKEQCDRHITHWQELFKGGNFISVSGFEKCNQGDKYENFIEREKYGR